MVANLWKKFKSFYNKEGCDFSTGFIDPFEFHQTFYRILVAFKVADINGEHPTSYFNQNTIIFIYGSLGIFFAFTPLCHGIGIFDIPLITEAGTYVIVLTYALVIISSTWKNLPQYHNFLRALKEDFHYICTAGEKYRGPFFENQLKTWKICIFTCIFCAIIPMGMFIFAFLSLFYYLATHKPEEEGSRPLLFPFWLPNVDFGVTPIYEMAFMFSTTCALVYSYNYVFMIQTQIVWVRQITSKVDIVIWSLQDLLVGVSPPTKEEERVFFSHVIQARMRDIIVHHQSMYRLLDDYGKVHMKLLMFEEKCCGPVVCLTAYCLFEKFDEGEFQPILVLMCIGTIVLYFIPCYLCTFLRYKVSSVCDACWSIPFWNAGPVIRPYLVLLMQRSLRSLPLQAPGFEETSIETFSKKMTSAYSLFNMLRQTNL